MSPFRIGRRAFLAACLGLLSRGPALASGKTAVTVYKDPG
jgi:hypothetical protein